MNFESLATIIEEYLRTKNYELYTLRLGKLFGHYESFVKQEICADIQQCLDDLEYIGGADKIIITSDKTIYRFTEKGSEE